MSNSTNSSIPPKLLAQDSVLSPPQGAPPELPRNKNRLGRITAITALGVVLMLALIWGLFLISQLTRKDKPEDYVLLANMLFEPIQLNGESPIQLSEAEKALIAQKLPVRIQKIARRDRDLSPVAADISNMFSAAEEIAKNAPQGSKFVFGLAEAVLGGYTGQRQLVGSGGQKALQEAERGWGAVAGVMDLFKQKHLAAVRLAEVAPKFSGPLTNAALVGCVFAQHEPGFLEVSTVQSVTLHNNSETDLENCAIIVRLSNAKGESYVNLHFAPKWPSGGNLVARYSDTDYPNDTIGGVVRVDVSVRADKWSVETITLNKPANGWPAF